LGRLSALSIFLWKYILYGAFVWARRALNSQKRRLPARAVKEYVYHFRQLALANRSVEDIDPARPPARQELVPSALAPPRSVPGVFHICILALDRLIYHGVCTRRQPPTPGAQRSGIAGAVPAAPRPGAQGLAVPRAQAPWVSWRSFFPASAGRGAAAGGIVCHLGAPHDTSCGSSRMEYEKGRLKRSE
jgi:hypothetical protein